ncbi:hypothetical protein [Streptomyces sp. HSG2]|uniref:hypothetical protein n=1 Tax=Streptomyces sp. HSG2 TaxID=2797167 RepID=UPI001905B9F1|nr:hypothetical protein [Streptomyces sp. HSG2]
MKIERAADDWARAHGDLLREDTAGFAVVPVAPVTITPTITLACGVGAGAAFIGATLYANANSGNVCLTGGNAPGEMGDVLSVVS